MDKSYNHLYNLITDEGNNRSSGNAINFLTDSDNRGRVQHRAHHAYGGQVACDPMNPMMPLNRTLRKGDRTYRPTPKRNLNEEHLAQEVQNYSRGGDIKRLTKKIEKFKDNNPFREGTSLEKFIKRKEDRDRLSLARSKDRLDNHTSGKRIQSPAKAIKLEQIVAKKKFKLDNSRKTAERREAKLKMRQDPILSDLYNLLEGKKQIVGQSGVVFNAGLGNKANNSDQLYKDTLESYGDVGEEMGVRNNNPNMRPILSTTEHLPNNSSFIDPLNMNKGSNRDIPSDSRFEDDVNEQSKRANGLLFANAVTKGKKKKNNDPGMTRIIKDYNDAKNRVVGRKFDVEQQYGAPSFDAKINPAKKYSRKLRNITRVSYKGIPIAKTVKKNSWNDSGENDNDENYFFTSGEGRLRPSKMLGKKIGKYIKSNLSSDICYDTTKFSDKHGTLYDKRHNKKKIHARLANSVNSESSQKNVNEVRANAIKVPPLFTDPIQVQNTPWSYKKPNGTFSNPLSPPEKPGNNHSLFPKRNILDLSANQANLANYLQYKNVYDAAKQDPLKHAKGIYKLTADEDSVNPITEKKSKNEVVGKNTDLFLSKFGHNLPIGKQTSAYINPDETNFKDYWKKVDEL